MGVGAENRLDDAGAGGVVEMLAGHARLLLLELQSESSGCWWVCVVGGCADSQCRQ